MVKTSSFKQYINTWWGAATVDTSAGLRVQSKLMNLKNKLNSCDRTTFGNVTRRLEELLQEVLELDSQEDLEGLLEELRSYWITAKDEFPELVIR